MEEKDKYKIRNIIETDWEGIGLIQEECYPVVAREEIDNLKCHWQIAPDFCWVAESKGRLVAYLLTHPWVKKVQPPINLVYSQLPQDADTLFIHDLALLPEARGRGLAVNLVKQIFEIASFYGLAHFSLISVQGTSGFWQKLGFCNTSDLPSNYFENLESYYPSKGYVYMEKDL